jgi:hypothetical protein
MRKIGNALSGGMIGKTISAMEAHHKAATSAAAGADENTSSNTGRTGQSTDSWNKY